MLDNHSISIQRIYKKIGGLLPLGLLFLSSCSVDGIKAINQKKSSQCALTDGKVEQRILIMAAKSRASKLAYCFSNYLRFEKNKKQEINTCHQLSIRKNGKVSYTQITGIGKKLSNDLEMCMEQEYWKASFPGLQLESGHTIRFPLKFSSL